MSTTSNRSNTRSREAPAELNQMQAAKLLGVSVRQFQSYGIEPAARRGRQVFYTIAALVAFAAERAHRRGYELGQREAKTPENAAEMLAARDLAELKLTQERAEYQRLRNAELRRELVPVELLTWALSDLASQIGPLLQQIPGEMKRRAPKLTHQDIHVMREVVAGALNLCAEVRLDWDSYPGEAGNTGDLS